MIPIGAGSPPPDGEDVVVPRPRRDGIVWAAVGVGGEIETVPVNGGRLGQAVVKMDNHPVAFVYLQSRTGNTAVVGENVGGRAGQQCDSRRRGRQRDLDHPGTRRPVLQNGLAGQGIRRRCKGPWRLYSTSTFPSTH